MMNLKAYFDRIGYKGPFDKPDLETLNSIHRHHIQSIPFENLSIQCGETISMDLDIIYNKIVRSSRGGWCFENNLLFSWVLKEMGYKFTIMGSRVYDNHTKDYGKYESHLILQVVIDGMSYIADVSFGMSNQIWEPLELISGKDQPQLPAVFRLVEDNGVWAVEKTGRKHHIPNKKLASSPLIDIHLDRKIYCFTLTPRGIDHFVPTSQYLQTSPESLFTNKSICSLQTPTGFRGLVGWTYSEVTFNYQDGVDLFQMSTIPGEEVDKVLKEKFGVVLANKLRPIDNKVDYCV
ncbi:arylamine N-acetyltransferase, pineal gland isozyme NAT-3 [Amia ocellicauda]|uniref:arylamine N-acetyltransferase, pineal gland isozyme NAT-3 n=1 Tax=Amia ocellicauda TaxID=2972642 RepID=UPI003464686C